MQQLAGDHAAVDPQQSPDKSNTRETEEGNRQETDTTKSRISPRKVMH